MTNLFIPVKDKREFNKNELFILALNKDNEIISPSYIVYFNNKYSLFGEIKYEEETDGYRVKIKNSKLPENVSKIVFLMSSLQSVNHPVSVNIQIDTLKQKYVIKGFPKFTSQIGFLIKNGGNGWKFHFEPEFYEKPIFDLMDEKYHFKNLF